eukprot:g115.t1
MQLSQDFEFYEGNSESFIVNRARKLLKSHLEEKGAIRITYIALKQQLISEFGETEFGRNKGTIQKLLQEATCMNIPKIGKVRSKENSNQGMKKKKQEEMLTIGSKGKNTAANVKSPRLYFYKMNEEETGSAEGNRYISNDDL